MTPVNSALFQQPMSFDLQPGQSTFVQNLGQRIATNRVRIWGVTADGKTIGNPNQDIFVVPQVANVFAGTKRALPLLTVVMLATSDFVRSWGLALLALFDVLVLAHLVGDGACTGAYGTADQRALASASHRADDGSASGCAADDLGAGVLAVVLAGLLVFGAVMLGLRGLAQHGVLLHDGVGRERESC